MKHTPGPWIFDDKQYDGRSKGYIRNSLEQGAYSIAQVTTTRKEWWENAKLIAAAPEMKSLLEQIAELRLPGLGMSGLQGKIYDLLDKVKGQE